MSDDIDFEILSLKNISHIYDQENHKLKVLSNINIVIKKGEMVSLIGPSGSGKSTLLNIAGLLEKPSIGSIYLIGKNCKNINEEAKANLRGSNIGFVFQSHRLFPEFSALENVMLPQLIMGTSKKQAESNSKELLAMLGLEKRFSHRPAKLSGGESQRVAIARAIANSPNLILADEPTGNLDPLSAQNVFDILYKVVKSLNISCLIATHNLVLAKSMDRCLFLENGAIKEQ
ncbi:ABC transporter ATP-binding protein [Alphaproteobacteria bacterium]|jgi:lipoprotein-releasing system ATP-binding protein|nr:ABC transporter ATP-binding protein [Alphaproteobacteria bacterium]MDA9816658.1 ABC transporter ATP-binding protein [Alphaproteobacteria bacterium]MDA9915280.1 ABC transporter ATP-binding protein [Alphaproteobacteria bacterium]MDB2584225.1 ABC transporter ATP-binding protein [Alphaproteobacteria bacterium]MDB3916738.1 ABC transporter ATP-binding protein [Alphaproteobacteria bacterium]